MRRILIVFVVALPLAVGACGGKGGGGGSGSKSAYCKALRDAANDALAQSKASTSTTASPEATKARIDTAFTKLTAHAPAEVKDDYKTVQDYYTLYLDTATNPATAQANRAKLTELAPKAQTAGKNIADYNKRVCKFDTTATSAATATTKAP